MRSGYAIMGFHAGSIVVSIIVVIRNLVVMETSLGDFGCFCAILLVCATIVFFVWKEVSNKFVC